MRRAELIDMVKRSGCAAGGAGFPRGRSGVSCPKPATGEIVAVNTDEGEPGTFKDRELVERDPHQVIEGVIIAAYAVGAKPGLCLYPRRVLPGRQTLDQGHRRRLSTAFWAKTSWAAASPGSLRPSRRRRLYLRRRDGHARVAGGKAGNPRLKPPYPAQVGLLGLPTLVHNIETLACIPQSYCAGRSGSPALAQRRAKGPRFSASAGTSTARATMNCRSARRCARSSTSMPAASGRRQPQGGHSRRGFHANADRRLAGCADGFRDAETGWQ